MKWIQRNAVLPVFALALALGVASCNKAPEQNASQDQGGQDQGGQDQGDPANANLAPVSDAGAATGKFRQRIQRAATARASPDAASPGSAAQLNQPRLNQPRLRPSYSQPAAAANSDQSDDYSEASYNPEPEQYAPQPPPELPEYQQPPIPEPGYIWTPGYWSYASAGYYWVPGVWVAPPYYGALWTPPYWGFFGGRYGFCHGYWGRYIGFYGGVNYGHGYTGRGYQGGYWHGNDFYYNRNVNNISNVHITNVYNRTIVNNITVNNYNRVSYNGGPRGIPVRPVPAEVAAYRAPHAPPMTGQLQLRKEAAANRAQFASVNHGKPAMFVAPRPVAADHGIAPAPVMRPVVNNRPHPANTMQPRAGKRHGAEARQREDAGAKA